MPGGVQVVVAVAYDCCVGVDRLGVLGSGDGVRSRTCDRWLMILESGGDCFRVEEVGGMACIENGSEVEVAVARGEITEEGNAFVDVECGLCHVPVLLQKFGVNLDVADDLDWWLDELMVWPRVMWFGSL